MATLEGTAELTAKLRALPAQVGEKVLRKSAAAGAKVVRDEVKLLAPIGKYARRRSSGIVTQPGVLRKAVLMKYAKERSDKDKATYIVTVRKGRGAQKTGRDAYYFPWVEKGHRIVGRGQGGLARRGGGSFGKVPAHPFFAPAYRSSYPRALNIMRLSMQVQVTTLLK